MIFLALIAAALLACGIWFAGAVLTDKLVRRVLPEAMWGRGLVVFAVSVAWPAVLVGAVVAAAVSTRA